MSDYSRLYDFSAKDALSSGDPNKLIKGSEVDDEFDSLVTHVATKFDTGNFATQVQAEAGALNTVIMTPLRVQNWADANAGMVGDIQAMTDPNVDTLLGWDDSAGAVIGFTPDGTYLTISGTSLTAGAGVQGAAGLYTTDASAAGMLADIAALTDPNADRLLGWDDSAGGIAGFQLGTGLTTNATPAITIDTAVVPQLSANNTFTGIPTVSGSSAYYVMAQTGQAADESVWFVGSTGVGQFILQTRTDAGGEGAAFMDVNRTGTTVDSIALAATVITLNGVAASDFARLSQTNTFTASQTISAQNSLLVSATGVQFVLQSINSTKTQMGTLEAMPLHVLTNSTDRYVLSASGDHDFKSGTVTTANASASEVGYKGVPSASDETPVLTDAGKGIIATTNVTIPANSSVAYPVGTVIPVYNSTASTITIAVTTDTLIWAQDGSTGTRTLSAKGVASLWKVASTSWVISGGVLT